MYNIIFNRDCEKFGKIVKRGHTTIKQVHC